MVPGMVPEGGGLARVLANRKAHSGRFARFKSDASADQSEKRNGVINQPFNLSDISIACGQTPDL
jgi:hypothetical protein